MEFSNIPYINKQQHIELLKWKMQQGQWRGILMKYAKELTEEEIQHASKQAFILCDKGDIIKAIRAYTVLKGVGVALASALLHARNKSIPFMSDEIAANATGKQISKLKYNLSEYIAVLHKYG